MYFAINAGVVSSESNYIISVVASVIVFVIFLLMACFCAPLTFSTVFKADAVRKVITFDATILGCISWRSMCSTCKFQDVQVHYRAGLHSEHCALSVADFVLFHTLFLYRFIRFFCIVSFAFQDVVINPAARDTHRVELHLKPTFGGPDSSRTIYVTDEVPAEDQASCDVAMKLLYSWFSCCCGLPHDADHEADDDANNPRRDNAARDAQPASVADDAASQRSKNTQKGPSAATLAAPLPPSYIVIETVNELKRVLDSVNEQQKQSDYAVAKIAESSPAVQTPTTAPRSLTKSGIIMPDMPKPKGPNSVRPRLPASLSSSLSLPSDASTAADDNDLSPWGALTAFDGAASERVARDILSASSSSFRGGSLSGHAFAAAGTGSLSSVTHSVASEFARPVFQRRAPTAARNAPAAAAADPSLLSYTASPSLHRPLVALPPLTSPAPPLASRQESFSYLTSASAPVAPLATAVAPPHNPSHAASVRDNAPAAFQSAAVDRVKSHDERAESHTPRAVVAPLQVPAPLVPHLPVANRNSVAPSLSAVPPPPPPLFPSATSLAAPGDAQDAAPATGVFLPPRDVVRDNSALQATSLPAVAASSSSDTAVLERILFEVSAANLLPRFIGDCIDDQDLGALALTKPTKLISKYGLNDSQVEMFIAACRRASNAERETTETRFYSQDAVRGQELQHAAVGEARSSAMHAAAANLQMLAPPPPSARPLEAALADARAPRARPTLPPFPSSFEK